MIYHDVKQGGDAWIELRLGIPTSSRFDCIVTPATLKISDAKGAKIYRHELLAEWLFGMPVDAVSTQFMDRGTALEDSARAWYEFTNDVEVMNGGFCTTDDGLVGDSPDGLIGDDGCLEIKTLGLKAHVGHMIGDLNIVPYRPQVYGHLWVTGRQWCDLCFYHPNLTPVLHRIKREDEVMDLFTEALERFNLNLALAQARLMKDKLRIDEQMRCVA